MIVSPLSVAMSSSKHLSFPLVLLLTLTQIANPSVAALYEDALVYESGSAITSSGALSAYSGAKTGRSPSDKRIVKEEGSERDVWWGPVNKPMDTNVSGLSSLRPHSWPSRARDISGMRKRALHLPEPWMCGSGTKHPDESRGC